MYFNYQNIKYIDLFCKDVWKLRHPQRIFFLQEYLNNAEKRTDAAKQESVDKVILFPISWLKKAINTLLSCVFFLGQLNLVQTIFVPKTRIKSRLDIHFPNRLKLTTLTPWQRQRWSCCPLCPERVDRTGPTEPFSCPGSSSSGNLIVSAWSFSGNYLRLFICAQSFK